MLLQLMSIVAYTFVVRHNQIVVSNELMYGRLEIGQRLKGPSRAVIMVTVVAKLTLCVVVESVLHTVPIYKCARFRICITSHVS